MSHTHLSRPAAGFTLIELLVAIGIIAVLGTILLRTYTGAQKRPYDAAAAQCGREIIRGEGLYRAEYQTYTTSRAALGEDVLSACAGVRTQSAPLANNAGAATNDLIGTDATAGNFFFQVFHPKGSGYFVYDHADGTTAANTRLNRIIKW
jgi:type IV pilus assembly protein PilA